MIELWEAAGMAGGLGGGPAYLPFAGGYAEQPAKLIDLFAIVTRAWSALRPKPRRAPAEPEA